MMHFSPRPPGKTVAMSGAGATAQRKPIQRLRSLMLEPETRSGMDFHVMPTSLRVAKRRSPTAFARATRSSVSSAAIVATALVNMETTGKRRKYSAARIGGALGRMNLIMKGATSAHAVMAALMPAHSGSTDLLRSAAARRDSASAAVCRELAATSLPPAMATLPTYSEVRPRLAASAAATGISMVVTFSSKRNGDPKEAKVSRLKTRSSPSDSLRFWPASSSKAGSTSFMPLKPRASSSSTLRTTVASRRSAATAMLWRCSPVSSLSRFL
mmetsp:Transcript_9385/g.27346  ORF Transcript_9385/g.27346 Transcript_9385/m.27346 type:complete len:271 (-) Transcript_9385:305-1117(-)